MQKTLSFSSLLESSLAEYKVHAKPFAIAMLWAVLLAFCVGAVTLISLGAAFATALANYGHGLSPVTIIIAVIGALVVVALMLLSMRFQFSLLHLILKPSEELPFWKRSSGRSFAFIGLSILTGLILLAGTILLVIPAILFYVWFVFAPQYFVFGSNIVESLKKSRALVMGNWWRTALNLAGAYLCVYIPMQLIIFLATILSARLGVVVSIITQLFIFFAVAPWTLVFMKQLREQLEALHAPHVTAESTDTNMLSA